MLLAAGFALAMQGPTTLQLAGGNGPGKGSHIVLLAGDEEYRSEEMLPQLAKILSVRHGFRCTVVFSLNRQGEIDPNEQGNQPGIEALQSADLCILMLRFRQWPDAQMRHFVEYYRSGKPLIALRTSTHAFQYGAGSASPYRHFGWQSREWPGGFGKQVLGETWVSHWGEHGKQATLGVLEPTAIRHPVLKGVEGLFGTTDVYEAAPPASARILVRGRVLQGMTPYHAPARGTKRTASGFEQPINDPMMPIVWTLEHRNPAGKTNRVLTCTMGAATDLPSVGFRRLLVNAAYWGVGKESKIPDEADVGFVGKYEPSPFGFQGFRRGIRPGYRAARQPLASE